MEKGRKAIIAAAMITAAALIGLGVFLGIRSHKLQVYTERVSAGDKYYMAGDYENALLAYEEAIEAAPTRQNGYSGMARVYMAEGLDSLSASTLYSGISHVSDDSQLRHMLAIIENGEDGKTDVVEASVNESMFAIFSVSSFHDYEVTHAVESLIDKGDYIVVRLSSIAADFVYRNTAYQPNAISGGRVAGNAIPDEIHPDDVKLLFGEYLPDSLEAVRSIDPSAAIEESAEHGHIVRFNAAGCTVKVASDENGKISESAWSSIIPDISQTYGAGEQANSTEEENREEEEPTVKVDGKVVNAQTGEPIEGAVLKYYEEGEYTAEFETETDSGGEYTVMLRKRPYLVEISKDGFITATYDLYLGAYASQETKDYVLSPELLSGEIRIVLSWGSIPWDLDSHLRGTTDSGEDVYVSWYHDVSMGGGNVLAELDVDDVDGYGPETTTIYDINGVYNFTVNDYRNTGLIESSEATVTVYLPGESPKVIDLSQGRIYEYDWDVFTIDHGKLTVH